jgi:DNA recombination protein RmuC
MAAGALLFLVGLAIGCAAAWFALRGQIAAYRRGRDELETTFRGLSAEALERSSASFAERATTHLESLQAKATAELALREQAVEKLVVPMKETLTRFDEHVRALEASRQRAYGELHQQVQLLSAGHERLRTETASLVKALRAPATRGRWGEMQLRRALELAGMLPHCDFVEQPTAAADDRVLRPDVIVKLAGGKNIVVDAKVPLEALLDAFDAADEDAREARLADFLRHVRTHMARLSAKAYWHEFSPTPEFVVMFLPSESFYRYAIENDAQLLDQGPRQRVILASPTTLISLLFAAAAGWREETLAESARQISEQGRTLYERLSTMGRHFATLGSRLDKAVAAYNETVGSLEARVLPAARRFPELGVSAKDDLPEIAPIERAAKPLTAVEFGRPEPATQGEDANAA